MRVLSSEVCTKKSYGSSIYKLHIIDVDVTKYQTLSEFIYIKRDIENVTQNDYQQQSVQKRHVPKEQGEKERKVPEEF